MLDLVFTQLRSDSCALQHRASCQISLENLIEIIILLVSLGWSKDWSERLDTNRSKMSDLKKSRTFSRKNTRNLALSAQPSRSAAPSAGDAQIPGALGNSVSRTDTLEIGVEFKLDLRSEDLIVLKELGAGNGGTVSKVMHAATKVIMAKKVSMRMACAGGISLNLLR